MPRGAVPQELKPFTKEPFTQARSIDGLLTLQQVKTIQAKTQRPVSFIRVLNFEPQRLKPIQTSSNGTDKSVCRIVYFTQGISYIQDMPKRKDVGWGLFYLGGGVTAFVALIATSGTLPKWAVVLLCFLTGAFFSAGVIQLGWLQKSPYLAKPVRAIFMHVLIWACVLVSGRMVWPKEVIPLDENMLLKSVAFADLIDYPPGTTGSIKWKDSYTHVRLDLNNPGAEDYTEVDLTITLDEAIAEMDQITKFPGVTFFPIEPVNLISGNFTRTDRNGKRTDIPLIVGRLSSSSRWRIRCDRILRQSSMRFVMAGVVLNIPDGLSLQKDDSEYGPRRVPTILDIAGSYKVGERLVDVNKRLGFRPLQQ
jgi:hypothetical protein